MIEAVAPRGRPQLGGSGGPLAALSTALEIPEGGSLSWVHLVMSITIAGKIALVTGAGRGIGKGIARVLASDGAKVLVSNRSEVTARAVAAAIRDAGGQASHVACDVTKEADLRRAVSTVIERYGRL